MFGEKMTIANRLTILRIIMIPLFVVLIYNPLRSYQLLAAGVYMLAAITDFLDGYLARRKGEVTNFGKIFDPIADKVLVLGALIPLVDLGSVPGWVVIVLLAREFIVGGFRNVVSAQGGKVIAASILGKAKTVSQITFIIVMIMKPIWFSNITFPFEWVIMGIALILTVWSMVDYIINGVRELNAIQKAALDQKGITS